MRPALRWPTASRAALELAVWLAIAGLGPAPASAADPRIPAGITSTQVDDAKRTIPGLYVTAREAHALLTRYPDVLLVDVRSLEQVRKDGLAEGTHKVVPFLVPSKDLGAGNVPGAFDRARMRINPGFLDRIQQLAGGGPDSRARTILVICPDGSHSALAVDHLAEKGYSNVYLIIDGIGGRAWAGVEGWRAQGLPWLAAPRAAQLD